MTASSASRARRGIALLEALAAVAILGIAGVSAVTFVVQMGSSVDRMRATEDELRAASRFLELAALWPREDYDRRLGDRAQGPWRLRIDRDGADVYVLTLTDSTTHRNVLLRTAVYRQATASATPTASSHADRR